MTYKHQTRSRAMEIGPDYHYHTQDDDDDGSEELDELERAELAIESSTRRKSKGKSKGKERRRRSNESEQEEEEEEDDDGMDGDASHAAGRKGKLSSAVSVKVIILVCGTFTETTVTGPRIKSSRPSAVCNLQRNLAQTPSTRGHQQERYIMLPTQLTTERD